MEKSTFKRRLMFVVCMLMCGLSIQAADDGLITDQIIIDKLVAGTLPQRISSDEKNLITNLKIKGEINGTDLGFIREMAGRSVKGENMDPGKETEGKLSILDLSDAKIVSGGEPYYQEYDYMEDRYNNYFTKDNEIGYKAFWYCDLTNVTLPSSLVSIGERAFDECHNLTSVTPPSSLVSIDEGAFCECTNLTSVTFPSGLTSIGRIAFFACHSLTNVTFPSSLTEIGDAAFGMCSFKSLTLPSSLTKIGESAFQHCIRLKSLYVGWQNPLPAGRIFDEFEISDCTLYVPQGTRLHYSGTEVWRDFGEIKEYDVSGVDKVDNHSEAKEVSRYSLDGQLLSAPVKGLNIVRYSDGSTKKAVVN